jgi:hypothetical protein
MRPTPALPWRLPVPLLALLGATLFLSNPGSATPRSAAGGPPPLDPFSPGERWCLSADSTEPWIPRDIAMVGDGELIWAAPAGVSPRLLLLATAPLGADEALLFEDDSVAAATGSIEVAAGDEASELFALAQYDDLPPPARRSVVTRHDALAHPGGPGSFTPVWSHPLAERGNGGALLAATPDGEGLVAACFDAARSRVWVERIDPATGTPLATAGFSGLALRGLVVSDDGRRIALLVGLEALLVDENLALLHTESLSAAGAALAISGDGRRVAIGDPGALYLIEDRGGVWTPLSPIVGAPGELLVAAALSRAGGVMALSWWNSIDGVSVRCEILDLDAGASLGVWSQSGVAGGMQNFPESLAITPDGDRVAVGVWGLGDAQPEVVLLDSSPGGGAFPILEVDLPGSVHALALDPSGGRIALATKDSHANHFSAQGSVRLHDSGERDLQLTGVTRLGGTLEVAFSRPGAAHALFAVGDPLLAPLPLPPLLGELWLDLSAPLWLWSAPCDLEGRASLSLAIPPDPAYAGLETGVQGVGFLPRSIELSSTLVRPILF